MAATEHSRFTRRTVLTGAAALFAAGAVAPRIAVAAGPTVEIRSATARGGQLLALTAESDSGYAIRRFTVDEDQRVRLGGPLEVEFPEAFHPHSIAADSGGLWVSGSVDRYVKTVTVDNRPDALPERLQGWADPEDADPELPEDIVDIDVHQAEPGLLRVRGTTAEAIALPSIESIRSGRAAAVAPMADGVLAVVIEGSPDPDLALITRSHLAVSLDDGATWREHPVADGLGEGHGTALAAVGPRLVAFAADEAGDQTVHTGDIDTGLQVVGTVAGGGRPMAAVVESGRITLFSERDGRVHESRFTPEGRALEAASDCGCTGEVVAVAGLEGAWLEVDGDTVRARGAG